MGQKINPTGFRLSISRNWASRWYANDRDFAGMLAEDIKVREYLKAKLKNASVSRVLIERPAKNARITIFSARPGVVIGKKGEDIENLKRELSRQLGVPVEFMPHVAPHFRGITMTVNLWLQQAMSADAIKTRYREFYACLLYTSPSPRDRQKSRMPSSA